MRLAASLLALLPLAAPRADVESVEIDERTPVLDGTYERLVGTIRFAFDPANPANAAIVDLERAERGDDGLVRADADLFALRPVDTPSGTALIEVSNRGGKASLSYFCRGRGAADPRADEHFGDAWLMRRGLTVIWVGWQFDVPDQPGRMRLRVPVARGADGPLEGLVRSDWVVDREADELALGHRDHRAYAVLDPEHTDNVLTRRSGRLAPREVVPRDAWRFDASGTRITGRFEAGWIYELVYRAADPAVVGLGLAAIRDTASYAKHDADSPFAVERAVAVGISQTGRFLRHYLYQGFNADERGRRALDGMLIHTAGAGRGSFNHRFAQPSRDAHRYSAFFYPTDVFPFSGRAQHDASTGRREGLLSRTAPEHRPRIFYTNTGYEYWGRAASLLHTSLDGSADVEPLADERIYHLASTQHFPVGFPPRGERGNPIDLLVTERALLAALLDWVEADVEPPRSRYPRVDDGTLVPIDEVAFPSVPGATFPGVAHEAYRADYGPRFWSEGIVERQPPVLGSAFATRVAQVDRFGNERAGVPSVELLCPLATYAPWHLRGDGELTDFYGSFWPLARTRAEADAAGDGRPAIEELWDSREAYLAAAREAAERLVGDRFLLAEDVERVVERAGAVWDHVSR